MLTRWLHWQVRIIIKSTTEPYLATIWTRAEECMETLPRRRDRSQPLRRPAIKSRKIRNDVRTSFILTNKQTDKQNNARSSEYAFQEQIPHKDKPGGRAVDTWLDYRAGPELAPQIETSNICRIQHWCRLCLCWSVKGIRPRVPITLLSFPAVASSHPLW